MGTFELDRNNNQAAGAQADANCVEPLVAADTRRIKQECIIAFKVYDQCRHQDCKIHRAGS